MYVCMYIFHTVRQTIVNKWCVSLSMSHHIKWTGTYVGTANSKNSSVDRTRQIFLKRLRFPGWFWLVFCVIVQKKLYYILKQTFDF